MYFVLDVWVVVLREDLICFFFIRVVLVCILIGVIVIILVFECLFYFYKVGVFWVWLCLFLNVRKVINYRKVVNKLYIFKNSNYYFDLKFNFYFSFVVLVIGGGKVCCYDFILEY